MKISITILLLVATTAAASPVPRDPATVSGPSGVFSCGAYRGTNWFQVFSMADSISYPKWEPGAAPCPVSPDEAYRLASRALCQALPQAKDWGVWRITLDITVGRIWFWAVTFTAPLPEPNPHPQLTPVSEFNVFVGLDKSVPKVEKQTDKKLRTSH